MNNAAIEDIEATIEELLDGNYQPPEPYQNLGMGLRRIQMAYLKARRDGAPENILEDMRRWIESADYIMKETAAEEQAEMQMMVQERMMEEQAMQGAPAGGGPPMAAPEAGPPAAALAPQAQLLRPTGIPS
jgi:hypothetical protein